MEILQAMPNSLEAEQAVLGCILDKGSMDDVIGMLESNDFYTSRHRFIFSTLFSMYKADKPIDIITLSEELKRIDILSQVGGITYLVELKDGVVILDNLLHYAQIVKDKAAKRQLILSAKEVLKDAYDDSEDVKNILSRAESSMFILSNSNSKEFRTIGNCIEGAIQNIESNYSRGGGIIGVPTGYKNLDRHTNGLQKGDFVLLAARPSMGKTAFALNLASNVANNGKVAIFSLEMSSEQLTQRLLSSESMLEFSKVRAGALNDNEWVKLTRASSIIANKNIVIDDSASLDISEIKAKCKRLKIKQGLDVVLIDYLQLVRLNEKVYSREQEVSKVSAALKSLAKDLDITVIALSQLSRAPEQRLDHRPQLGDLRDSGSLEQDADIIMFLYRDEYYNPESEEKNIAEVIIGKNRNGQVGTTKLAWLGTYQKFGELDVVHR